MRIVVFTTNYPPLINPRAFRIGKLYEIKSKNQNILIITSPVKDYFENETNIIRCGLTMNQDPQFRNKFKRNIFFRLVHKYFWPDDKLFHQFIYFINYILKYRKKNDIILTVSNPFSSHVIGLLLKKIWGHYWKADMGDIYYGNQHHSIFSKYLEKIVLYQADLVILNSESMRDHFISLYNIPVAKMTIIPNGISIDISRIKKTSTDAIRLSYIGNTYAKVREAIEELNIFLKLVKEHPEKNLRIQLFGNQYYKVEGLAGEHPDLIQINFCKNKEELIQAYSNTDVLVNFANMNNPGLPSKLEEYVASELPIINFIHSEKDASFAYLKPYGARVFHFCIGNPNLELLVEFIQTQISRSATNCR